MSISTQNFGKLPTGEDVQLFTLKSENGISIDITNYGGIIVRLFVPDSDGKNADIVLGKDTLEDYLGGHPHFGAITGRVAGRIGGARFKLDGVEYKLDANNGKNFLHGGLSGFDKQLWKADIITDASTEKLRLTYTDPDGHNGLPGEVDCTVTYSILDDTTLEITYFAETTTATPLNLTNHSYFNLNGAGSGDVLDHTVQIFSGAVAAIDASSTLTGVKNPVKPGYNDYQSPVSLDSLPRLEPDNADIHYFLEYGQTAHPKPAAVVTAAKSGRKMEVFTTEPGVQFYAGLSLSENEPEIGKAGAVYQALAGLCLETQDYPDSVNFPKMGNALIRPGEPFKSTTLYRFKTL